MEDSINRYLNSSTEEVRSRIVQLPEDTAQGWEEPDRLFMAQLQ